MFFIRTKVRAIIKSENFFSKFFFTKIKKPFYKIRKRTFEYAKNNLAKIPVGRKEM